MIEVRFINGIAIIKEGKKVLAKITNRLELPFYIEKSKKESIKLQYPFHLEVKKLGGVFTCISLEEATTVLQKWIDYHVTIAYDITDVSKIDCLLVYPDSSKQKKMTLAEILEDDPHNILS